MSLFRLVPGALAALCQLPFAIAQDIGVMFDPNVDGYIEVPYAPEVVPQSGITVEAWITYDDATLPSGWRYPTILRQGLSVGGSEDWFLRVNADNVGARVLRWKVVTATGFTVVDWTFAPGQLVSWTHVAATYDGNMSVLYVNGVPVGSAVGSGEPIRDVGNEVLRIGKGSDIATPIEVWNGGIDEVRLWPFARTQGEIQATMNQKLAGVPGVVSTWNLDGFFVDTSGNLHATASGNVVFTANPLTLSAPVPAIASGASTPGCLGDLHLAPTSIAQVGNLDFGVVCARTPPGALALWGATVGVLPSPFPLLGVDIWLDPNGLVAVTVLANVLGAVRVGIPVPATAPLGFSFGLQSLVLDPCGPQLFTASDALTVVVLP